MADQSGMIDFRCSCGRGFRVTAANAGKAGKCPSCGAAVRVPQADLQLRPPAPKPVVELPEHRKPLLGMFKIPTSFGEFAGYLLSVWGVVAVVAFIGARGSIYAAIAWAVVFLVSTGFIAQLLWQLMRARVVSDKDAPLLWGFVR